MANPENTANDQASAPTTNARAQFESERMTRRAALRKFGFGAGMAALLALSSDDLARMAAQKLAQRVGDNRVAEQVGKELRNAGVVFASGTPTPCEFNVDDNGDPLPCGNCTGCGGCTSSSATKWCIKCVPGCTGSKFVTKATCGSPKTTPDCSLCESGTDCTGCCEKICGKPGVTPDTSCYSNCQRAAGCDGKGG